MNHWNQHVNYFMKIHHKCKYTFCVKYLYVNSNGGSCLNMWVQDLGNPPQMPKLNKETQNSVHILGVCFLHYMCPYFKQLYAHSLLTIF
jgi:hypothetical protein